eukprot:TRINITY_DN6158_c0_g2_i2.p1 TRINITY_DN6158_c0_g2~~TRINITY_DN6158_c0_g2_i2.p1  ORF type:complete len:259 (-),score=34.47 TRINITY_DN6158_c0_g2_i2:69-788(-)
MALPERIPHYLASHDVKTRNQGIKLTEKWLSKQLVFTETSYLKAWKALFFCFWHSDKPLVQQDLARRLANMIHLCTTMSNSCLFMSAFWRTMCREWQRIDKLRLDKFMSLCRFFLAQSMAFCSLQDWSEERAAAFAGILNPECKKLIATCYVGEGETPVLPGGDTGSREDNEGIEENNEGVSPQSSPINLETPCKGPLSLGSSRGLLYHILDIYMQELVKVVGDRGLHSVCQVFLFHVF